MKLLSKFFLAVLLLTVATVSWAACPEGQKQTYKGCDVIQACPEGYRRNNLECSPVPGASKRYYPYGGTCDPISRSEALSIASEVIINGHPSINRCQQSCKHNIRLIEEDNEKILKISTRLGDGRGNILNPWCEMRDRWSDIEEGNRRRFEIGISTDDRPSNHNIKVDEEFRFEFSIRIPEDNKFLIPGQYEHSWFWITQLKGQQDNIGAVTGISVDRRQGAILTFGGSTIQSVRDFGKWVKVAIEFRASRKEKGYARLWVDDELVYEAFDYQNIANAQEKDEYLMKFGIYQGVTGGTNSMIHQKQQQSVEFKDISLKRMN